MLLCMLRKIFKKDNSVDSEKILAGSVFNLKQCLSFLLSAAGVWNIVY